MRKTRDLFKKIRDTKGTFHAKMDTIKDRNGMDLTEAEDIKKRWQEYIPALSSVLLLGWLIGISNMHVKSSAPITCLFLSSSPLS
jgi:hypothetical protein